MLTQKLRTATQQKAAAQRALDAVKDGAMGAVEGIADLKDRISANVLPDPHTWGGAGRRGDSQRCASFAAADSHELEQRGRDCERLRRVRCPRRCSAPALHRVTWPLMPSLARATAAARPAAERQRPAGQAHPPRARIPPIQGRVRPPAAVGAAVGPLTRQGPGSGPVAIPSNRTGG